MIDRDRSLAIESAVSALGYAFWGFEWLSEGGERLLRVYIDSPQGVTADDCQAVSRQVLVGLSVLDEGMDRSYRLEVSSPGIDRRLFTLHQAKRYVGETLVMKLGSPVRGRRRLTGVLLGVGDDARLTLKGDDHEDWIVEWSQIEKVILKGGATMVSKGKAPNRIER